MRIGLPGVGGSMFPSRYLADQFLDDVAAHRRANRESHEHHAALRRRLQYW